MNREYHTWYSDHLNKDMQLLVFGTQGSPVILFPTRTARFYDYENWNIIDALAHKIESGFLQVFCVDSNDIESFYNQLAPPADRMPRHLHYEQYILQEVIPFIKMQNATNCIIAAGCSLGGYHAVNIAFKHPQYFGKVVGISGRYDLSASSQKFPDLFDGYRDELIAANMPSLYMGTISDENKIRQIARLEIFLAVGKEDPFAANNICLHQLLTAKGIANHIDFWEGEAHRCSYWRTILPCYL